MTKRKAQICKESEKMSLLSIVRGDKLSKDNIEEEIDKICMSDVDNDIKNAQMKYLFKKYTYQVVLPEVLELLKIMYDGDTKRIKSDIMVALLVRAGKEK